MVHVMLPGVWQVRVPTRIEILCSLHEQQERAMVGILRATVPNQWTIIVSVSQHARASKEKIGDWTALIHAYLLGRPNLRRLCLLIDSRHGLKKSDEALMAELDNAAVVYQIVLTKTDKISGGALEALTKKIVTMFPRHPAAFPTVIATSSRDGVGIEALRASLATLAAPDQFR